MGLVDIAKYANSRVGAVFSQEHADRVIEMVTQMAAELALTPAEPEPEPPQKETPEAPETPSD